MPGISDFQLTRVMQDFNDFWLETLLGAWVPRQRNGRPYLHKLTIKIDLPPSDIGRWCKDFGILLSNNPQLASLHVYNKDLHLPPVIAALCAHQDSALEHLTLTLGEVIGQDLSVLRRLELQNGKLRTVSFLEGSSIGYPDLYAHAIAHILSSSAGTITSLELPAQGVNRFLKDLPGFPNLEVLHAWSDTIAESPCFASVQPKLHTLVWLIGDINIFSDAEGLQSFAERFPSLVELTVEVRVQSSFNEQQLYAFGAHFIAHCSNLTNVTLTTPEQWATPGLDTEHRVAAEWRKHLGTLKSIVFKQGSEGNDSSAVLVTGVSDKQASACDGDSRSLLPVLAV